MPVFAAIGAAVAGSIGVSVAAAGFAATMIGVVSVAVVGAAVGGLSAAVTGGDIGKGMLFGAVGAVATAGIASGLSVGMGGTGTFGIGGGLQPGPVAGTLFDPVSQEVVKGTMAQTVGQGSSSIFGGALGDIMGASTDSLAGTLLTKGIDFAAGAMTEEPYNPNMDPDFLRENREDIQAHDKDMAKLGASLRGGGGGGGGAKMPWQNTEEGAKYTLAEQYKQAKLREDSAMGRLQKQFALQDQSMEKEFNMATAKYGEAADVAGGQEFQGASDEAKAAVLAKQGGGDAALQGE